MKLKNLSDSIILNALTRKWAKFTGDRKFSSIVECLQHLEHMGVYDFPFDVNHVVVHPDKLAVLGDACVLTRHTELVKALYNYQGLVMLVQDINIVGVPGLYFVKSDVAMDPAKICVEWLSRMGLNKVMYIHVKVRHERQQDLSVLTAPLNSFQIV